MPHKGPRDQFIARPTLDVGARIREDSKRTGKCNSDIVAEILAAHYGLPAYNNSKVSSLPAPVQEALDMTG